MMVATVFRKQLCSSKIRKASNQKNPSSIALPVLRFPPPPLPAFLRRFPPCLPPPDFLAHSATVSLLIFVSEHLCEMTNFITFHIYHGGSFDREPLLGIMVVRSKL